MLFNLEVCILVALMIREEERVCNVERGFERERKKEECDFAGTWVLHFMWLNLIYFIFFCFFMRYVILSIMADTSSLSKIQWLLCRLLKRRFGCVDVVSSLLQVFKILVRKTQDESWVVFRRYTDFSRLNDKVSLDAFFSAHVQEVKCRKSHISVQKHWQMITNWGQCLRWASQHFRQASLYCWIGLWKWLELHKEALCFQIASKPEPRRGNRSPVIWGNAARNWRHYIILFQVGKKSNTKNVKAPVLAKIICQGLQVVD